MGREAFLSYNSGILVGRGKDGFITDLGLLCIVFSLSFMLSFKDNHSPFLKNWTVMWILLDVGTFLQPVGIVQETSQALELGIEGKLSVRFCNKGRTLLLSRVCIYVGF